MLVNLTPASGKLSLAQYFPSNSSAVTAEAVYVNVSGGACSCTLPQISTLPQTFNQKIYFAIVDDSELSIEPASTDTICTLGSGVPIELASEGNSVILQPIAPKIWHSGLNLTEK